MHTLPDVQLLLRPGIVEFGWGHPAPTLLPAAELARAAALTLERDGPLALAYGAEQGPGRLIAQLCARLGRLEGRTPSPEQLLITGGVSQALDLLCTLFTRPGDIVLVEAPTYHLALRIFQDHGLELLPIASDAEGLCLNALTATLARLHVEGRAARLLYTVPTFNNPTGATLSAERRAMLAALAQASDLLVLEDDVYRELWYDAPPPPSIFNLARPGPVIRLGSFAKLLAPGLRLGWLLAAPEIVQRCVRGGLLDSGGGVNHFTAHVVASLLELELFDPHVAHLRAAYRARRDTLLAALTRFLPPDCTWTAPDGGFFVWVGLPAGTGSAALLLRAEAAGVAYLPGARFYAGGSGDEDRLRLSFALLRSRAPARP